MYVINNNHYSVTHQRHNVRYKQQSILSNFTKDIMYVINNNQYSVLTKDIMYVINNNQYSVTSPKI